MMLDVDALVVAPAGKGDRRDRAHEWIRTYDGDLVDTCIAECGEDVEKILVLAQNMTEDAASSGYGEVEVCEVFRVMLDRFHAADDDSRKAI